MVSKEIAKEFVQRLQSGKPFKAVFPNTTIPVYGVAHSGSFGMKNVGGENTMRMAWESIAKEYKEQYGLYS